jgi:hypothetical protein
MVELLIASALFTGASIYSSNKAASATKKASQAQRRQESLAAAIQRRQQFKNYRQASAQAVQAGENQGVADSSGSQGGVGSLRSQLSSNVSFLDQQGQIADYAGRMFDKAATWSNRAQMLSSASDLSVAAYGLGQNKDFKKMFGKK